MTEKAVRWGVVFAVLVALVVRIGGSFGAGYPNSYYPDELNNVERSVNFYAPGKSPPVNLDPGWFNKPALGYYLNFLEFGGYYAWGRYVSGEFESSTDFANDFLNYDRGGFYAIARIANALFAALTVILAFRLTRRIWGPGAGLGAAFFLALSPGHIAWSQVVKHDVLGATLAIWALAAAIRFLGEGRPRQLMISGFFAGLGWAAKYLPGAVLIGAVLSLAVREPEGGRRFRALFTTGLAFLIGAFVGSPYNFLSPVYFETTLASQMAFCTQLLFGVNDVDPLQASLVGQIFKTLQVALETSSATVAVVILAAVGVVAGFFRARRETFVLAATFVFVLIVLAATNRQNPRPNHVVFLIPILVCAAGGGLVELCNLARRLPGRAAAAAIVVIVVSAFVIPVQGTLHNYRRVMTPHPYAVAQEWILANIPAGTAVINDGDKVSLIQADERIDWIFARIERLRSRAQRNLERLRQEGGDKLEPIAHWEGALRRLDTYQRKYEFLAPAARAFDGPRYDSLILLKIWQTESERDKKSQAGFNDLWARMPLLRPEGLSPVERYRFRPPRASSEHQVLKPVEYLVTSQASYDNYDKPAKRAGFPNWGAFYDDLRAHYDCWQVTGDKALGHWDYRIYDLRERVDSSVRAPRIVDITPSR